jgi:hypothetical protein
MMTAVAAPAIANGFGTPIALSVNGHANDASVGIDAAGNATAVWADGALYFSDHPSGGSWSTPATFFGGSGAGFSDMHMSAAGAATTITWGSLYGIYAIDRPAGGSWGAPFLLVSAPDLVTPAYDGAPAVIVQENATGDIAVVYQQYSGGATLVSALRRSAGGTWSGPETVVSSASVGPFELAGASIGAGGHVIVTWQTFQVSCTRSCHDFNYAVHASRETLPGSGWSDSGALTPQGSVWLAQSAIDPAGSAVMLAQPSFGTIVSSFKQTRPGAKWSAPATAYTAASGSIALIYNEEASSRGRVSLLTGAGGIWDVDGQIGTNTWGAAVNLANADPNPPVPVIAAGANDTGGLAATWVDVDGTVRAATRPSAVSAWSASQTLAGGATCDIGGVVCSGPAAATINDHGQAVVLYIRVDPTVTIFTLYAATN